MDGTNVSTTSPLEHFYRASVDIDSLELVPEPPTKHVLEQLGPPPFRKTTFPMMGFLASVYEHVAAQASGASPAIKP
jgi:hypothetical protein